MADRTTKVRLTAEVQSYIDGMQKAAQATRETGSATEKLAQQSQAFELMGRAAMLAGGAVVGGLTVATKAAIDWESAWAGVTKTVEGSDTELAAIEEGLRDLTSVLPASHTEIAAVAEAAGQLGIQTPNVVEFTRTMVDLGETTNLSAEQAATSLAQMMNIMGTSQSEVDRMGATLVALGNAGASTESEILMMAQRIAGAGKLVGATEGEVLGLSNALASMGVTAELGGGVASRILQDLYNAVQEGGESLDGFAKVAGVSSKEFAQAFENDPVRALDTFSKGLNGVEASGGNVVKTLTDLGFKSTEEQRVLLQLKGAGDLLTDSLDLQATAWEENSALTDEAAKRYETTAAKVSMAGNKIADAAITIGEAFLPVVEGGAEAIGGFADAISGLDGPMSTIVAWGGAVAGLGVLGGGLWLAAIPKIAEYKTALDTLDLTGGRLTRTLSMVGKIGGAAVAWGTLIALAGEADADVTGLTNALERNADAQTLLDKASEANANRGLAHLTSALLETELSAGDTAEALDYLREKGEAGFFWTRRINQGEIDGALGSLKVLGNELAKMSDTDLGGMQSQLKGLGDEFGWSRDQMWSFIENSPDLQDALEKSASQMGVGTEKADLLKIAFGEVKPAADEATAGVDENGEALSDFEQKAADAQQAVDDLAEQIRGFGDAQFDMRSANRELEDSFRALSESLEANGNNFDISTEAGTQNEAALDAVARGANEAAAAVLIQTGSQEAANAKLEEGRQRLIDILTPYYGSRDAAAAYVDQLNLISPQKVTDIVARVDAAQAAVEAYKASLAGVRDTITTTIQATVDLFTNLGENADGGMYAYANGGIEAYAGGGFATGIYKGGTPIHKFAEPETGWEAYISGKPDQRDRNRQIW